jgi:hypothetical protein
MKLRPLVRALAALAVALPVFPADIVLTPPVGGGVAVTNAAGSITRLRVADDGTFTLPGVAAVPLPAIGLCVEIATKKVGTCSASAFVQGGNAFGAQAVIGTTDGFALDFRVNASRVMRYEPNAISPNVIGGSPANSVTAGVRGATIGGGGVQPGDTDPRFFGETPNQVTGSYGTVGGGYANRAGDTAIDEPFAFVGGGAFNTASGYSSTVGGGEGNDADGGSSTVGGGVANAASGVYSVVGAGLENVASGNWSTVAGGGRNTASGDGSFAAGFRAKTQTAGVTPTVHQGAFVWSDYNIGLDFNSTANNEFAARATGGVRFVTAIDGLGVPTRTVGINTNGEFHFGLNTRQMLNLWSNTFGIGVQDNTQYFRSGHAYAWYRGGIHSNTEFAPGAGGEALMTLHPGAFPPLAPPTAVGVVRAQAFTVASDRNAKEAFAAVDGRQVLAALVQMPLQTWKYRNENAAVRHIGPTAQDFRANFAVGYDDKTIATVDADGVALAAIKGLYEVVAEKDRRIEALEAQSARVADFERDRMAQLARIHTLERELAAIKQKLGLR